MKFKKNYGNTHKAANSICEQEAYYMGRTLWESEIVLVILVGSDMVDQVFRRAVHLTLIAAK